MHLFHTNTLKKRHNFYLQPHHDHWSFNLYSIHTNSNTVKRLTIYIIHVNQYNCIFLFVMLTIFCFLLSICWFTIGLCWVYLVTMDFFVFVGRCYVYLLFISFSSIIRFFFHFLCVYECMQDNGKFDRYKKWKKKFQLTNG